MTREPEWDDESRGRATHHAAYKAGLCGCGCGLPYDVSHDESQAFLVDFSTCRARREIDKRQRDDSSKMPEGDPYGTAGRSYYAVPLDTETAAEMLAEQQAQRETDQATSRLADAAEQDIIPD